MRRYPHRRGGNKPHNRPQTFSDTTTTTATPSSNNNSNTSRATPPPCFRCPECLGVFPTWTKFTQHLETTQHFSARCVECRKLLKCFGPTYPYRHESHTGHRGFIGTFYVREDYYLHHPSYPTIPQYKCECHVVFLTPLALAEHLRNDHCVTAIKDEAVCLTCGVRGTLAEMTAHRLDKLNKRETHQFEVIGLQASRYLKRCPQLPPWPQEMKPYIVLYQCPVCILLFSSWDVMQHHLTITGHSQNILSLMRARPGHETGDEALSADEFEVFVDQTDPEMRALICETISENNYSNQDDCDRMVCFQCPKGSCHRVFLTHGELIEHMENENHYPIEQNEGGHEKDSEEGHHSEEDERDGRRVTPAQIIPARNCNGATYEVECFAKELVEIFGFSRCPHCRRVVTAGAEELIHMQMHHPEK